MVWAEVGLGTRESNQKVCHLCRNIQQYNNLLIQLVNILVVRGEVLVLVKISMVRGEVRLGISGTCVLVNILAVRGK